MSWVVRQRQGSRPKVSTSVTITSVTSSAARPGQCRARYHEIVD